MSLTAHVFDPAALRLLRHDAEHEMYLYWLPAALGFRSSVAVHRRLISTKTTFGLQATLKIEDLTSDTLAVYRVPGHGPAQYTLGVLWDNRVFPLVEGSTLTPETLVLRAFDFLCPDGAEPKPSTSTPLFPSPYGPAPRGRAAGRGAASVQIPGLDFPDPG